MAGRVPRSGIERINYAARAKVLRLKCFLAPSALPLRLSRRAYPRFFLVRRSRSLFPAFHRQLDHEEPLPNPTLPATDGIKSNM